MTWRVCKTGGFGGLQNAAYYTAMNAAYEHISRPMPKQQGVESEQEGAAQP